MELIGCDLCGNVVDMRKAYLLKEYDETGMIRKRFDICEECSKKISSVYEKQIKIRDEAKNDKK